MAKAPSNLAAMSVETLLKLRDDIGAVLSRKAGELKQQLSRLTGGTDYGNGKPSGKRRKTKYGKVAAKYRNPADPSQSWAGRGAMAGWLKAELKAGKKIDDFLVDKSAAPRKSKSAAKKRRKAK
jgi:DNA-binding protein H-NS